MRLVTLFLIFSSLFLSITAFAEKNVNIPILCYHNFNPTKPGLMNLTPAKFESQLKWLKDNGYHVIPLKEAVAYLRGEKNSLPPKAVVITVDDGWQSDYQYLFPSLKKFNMPATLFVYPEPISASKHFVTWDELKELQKSGLIDIQGHTFSHPNFKVEKRHMSAEQYAKFVNKELVNSKKVLEEKLGTKIDFLAWPFGIYDPYLEDAAKKAGYVMSFSIDAKAANRNFPPMRQPRFMIIDKLSQQTFTGIIKRANS